MSKWKIFNRSKPKQEDIIQPIETTEEEIEVIKSEPEMANQPLAEYHETLHTEVFTSKKQKTVPSSDQRIWRDVNSIEQKIDNLHKINAQKPTTEVEKTVDRLLEKKRRK